MYNNSLYNEPNYNDTWLYLDTFESLSSADQKTFLTEAVHSDIATLSDALSKALNNNPFLDDILASDDDVANFVTKYLADALSPMDAAQVETFSKVLAETVTMNDIRALVITRGFTDSLVVIDTITKSITDKSLSESIRLQSWLSLKRTGSHWSN